MQPVAREIRDLDARREAARLVESWSYPRRIWEFEILHGTWVTDEPQSGIAWLMPGLERGDWVLHGCAVPKLGRPALSPWTVDTLRCVAGLLGATRLYAPVPPELPRSRALLRCLRRLGWTAAENALGPYLELG